MCVCVCVMFWFRKVCIFWNNETFSTEKFPGLTGATYWIVRVHKRPLIISQATCAFFWIINSIIFFIPSWLTSYHEILYYNKELFYISYIHHRTPWEFLHVFQTGIILQRNKWTHGMIRASETSCLLKAMLCEKERVFPFQRSRKTQEQEEVWSMLKERWGSSFSSAPKYMCAVGGNVRSSMHGKTHGLVALCEW